VQATGIADGNILAVFVRGPDGKVIGGAYGWTWGDTCYIRSLYLPTNMRNQGVGTRIMSTVEQEAVARGCEQIVLETHDFQAPGFYRKLGFIAVGVVDGYPRGHQYFTMLKRLQPDGPAIVPIATCS
jgi:ribosomal protein S18 acetylase RimI-like enzyme